MRRRWLRAGRLDRGEQLGPDQLGDRHAVADVADRILQDVALRNLLAVVDQLAVKVDLEGPATRRRQGDANLAVLTGNYLACQTGSLIPVASRNAVAYLQLNLAFGHVLSSSLDT